MALTIPPGVDASGRRNIIFSPTNSPSVATLTGATCVEVSCYLTKGTFGITGETERGTDERECTTQVAEVLGKTTYSMADLDYVWEPQAEAASATNKAYDTLKEGTAGFIVVRYGIDTGTALTVGDKVDFYPVTLGPQIPKTPEGGSAEKLKIVQTVAIGLGILRDVVLTA